MNEILVVVPTYNERDNLQPLAQRLLGLSLPVDLLVVDDHSSDGTGEIADEIAKERTSMHVLHRTGKRGLGQAYIAGFKWALARDYEFVVELDGDLSHSPEDIPAFIAAAGEADLVLGSRYVNGIRIINWSLRRLMLSKGASLYVRLVTGMPFTDPTGGYKCFRRRALQALNLDAVHSNGYSFQIEITHLLWRQGMRIVEVPIVFTDRFQGHSKMSGQIVREALWMVWRLWLQSGLRRRPRTRPARIGPRQQQAMEVARATSAPTGHLRSNIIRPSRRTPIAYGIFAIAVAGSIGFDFASARRREPVHGRETLPLVTRERASATGGPWEMRHRGGICLMVRGLSLTEVLPEERLLWRHALAPSTVITVAPRQRTVRVRFALDNSLPGQEMTVSVGGREVDQRRPLPVGRATGEFDIPASTDEFTVEFKFARWDQAPAPDTRRITATFRELTFSLL
ncbi:MAG TPA: polyprenol monophosphomannose synthase [Opitutaceae bacterium]|nr:polyprenol monophosphomannose synthase [Opitutaceae bacterium]